MIPFKLLILILLLVCFVHGASLSAPAEIAIIIRSIMNNPNNLDISTNFRNYIGSVTDASEKYYRALHYLLSKETDIVRLNTEYDNVFINGKAHEIKINGNKAIHNVENIRGTNTKPKAELIYEITSKVIDNFHRRTIPPGTNLGTFIKRPMNLDNTNNRILINNPNLRNANQLYPESTAVHAMVGLSPQSAYAEEIRWYSDRVRTVRFNSHTMNRIKNVIATHLNIPVNSVTLQDFITYWSSVASNNNFQGFNRDDIAHGQMLATYHEAGRLCT